CGPSNASTDPADPAPNLLEQPVAAGTPPGFPRTRASSGTTARSLGYGGPRSRFRSYTGVGALRTWIPCYRPERATLSELDSVRTHRLNFAPESGGFRLIRWTSNPKELCDGRAVRATPSHAGSPPTRRWV